MTDVNGDEGDRLPESRYVDDDPARNFITKENRVKFTKWSEFNVNKQIYNLCAAAVGPLKLSVQLKMSIIITTNPSPLRYQ